MKLSNIANLTFIHHTGLKFRRTWYIFVWYELHLQNAFMTTVISLQTHRINYSSNSSLVLHFTLLMRKHLYICMQLTS